MGEGVPWTKALSSPPSLTLHAHTCTFIYQYAGDSLVSCPQPPDGTKREMDFLDSTFFKTPAQRLPMPAQVSALSTDICTMPQLKPITFRNPNIFVKFGHYVTVEEAQCLWMVQRAFQGTVPVPELFGWRVDNEGFIFICMQLIEG
ncbi:hypothetical protein BJX63DRAFT_344892 [Aspergillus granulosus]|uniref:Aminoglycoside phosphotransferase domain-containing protein n=1 Tax=Aspergillus granulosus TaxID=176169 RepID=A0ABR4H363_9EURO